MSKQESRSGSGNGGGGGGDVATGPEATALLETWIFPPSYPVRAGAAAAAAAASASASAASDTNDATATPVAAAAASSANAAASAGASGDGDISIVAVATSGTSTVSLPLVTPPSLPSTSAQFFTVKPGGAGGKQGAPIGYTPNKAAAASASRAAAAAAAGPSDPAAVAAELLAESAAAAARADAAAAAGGGGGAGGGAPSPSDEAAARMAIQFLLASPAEGGLGLDPEDLLTAGLGGGVGTESNGDDEDDSDEDDHHDHDGGDDHDTSDEERRGRRNRRRRRGRRGQRAIGNSLIYTGALAGDGGGRNPLDLLGSRGSGGGGRVSAGDEPPLYGPGAPRALANAVERLEERLRQERGSARRARALSQGSQSDYAGASDGAAAAAGAEEGAENLTQIDETEVNVVSRLTSLVLRPAEGNSVTYPTTAAAHSHLISIYRHTPRRVCQYPFKKNDIVWVCRTCQSDETCVLCHACYSRSDHEGHDVSFYHAQAGGCCDCGDPDAWDPAGFCDCHGPGAVAAGGAGGVPLDVVDGAANVVGSICDWLVGTVVKNVELGYARCKPRVGGDRDRIGRGESMPVSYAPSLGNSLDASSAGVANTLPSSDNRSRWPRRRPHSVVGISESHGGEDQDEDMEDVDEEMATERGDSNDPAADKNVASADGGSSEYAEAGQMMVSPLKFDPSAASSSKSMMRAGGSRPGSDIEDNDSDDDKKPSASPLESSFEFDPEAASTSKSRSNPSTPRRQISKSAMKASPARSSPAYRLGKAGREGNGLYLVLHGDDVHPSSEILSALRDLYSERRPGDIGPAPFASGHTEAALSKAVRLLRSEGDLIVWGVKELVAEAGPVQSALWRDGDYAATERVGALVLARARLCSSRGLVVSIKTRDELLAEQRASAVIRWLGTLAKSCDPLCNQVSSSIKQNEHLAPMLRADLKLPAAITSAWHSLLLTLLAIPNFKAALANAYCDTYRSVTNEYARGVGVLDRSSYTLSVQFLNRVTYVSDLVRERNLMGVLSRSLLDIFIVAAVPVGPGGRAFSAKEAEARRSRFNADPFAREFGFMPSYFGDFLSPWARPGEEAEDLAQGRRGTRTTAASIASHGEIWLGHGIRKPSAFPSEDALVTTLDPNHPVLTHRRYSPCISDLKCVLNVPGMARLFASVPLPAPLFAAGDDISSMTDQFSFLYGWIQVLSLGQNMDGQVWRTWGQGHVERESRGWVGAFNASISLGSLFERLLSWDDSDPSPLESTAKTRRLLTCAELAHFIMTTGLYSWQRSEMLSYHPSENDQTLSLSDQLHSYCPSALSYCTIASNRGTALASRALPISQVRPWSFHLPLHRFVASCLREVALRPADGNGSIKALIAMLKNVGGEGEMKKQILLQGLAEFPLAVLARAAQIRAGLWKRNGPAIVDQVLNYSEPPFCRSLRDADLTLLQFALIGCQPVPSGDKLSNTSVPSPSDLGIDCAHLVNLILNRFGIFDFCGLQKAPDSNVDRYHEEILAGIYPGEVQRSMQRVGVGIDTDTPSPSSPPHTYSPASKDVAQSLALLEEALHLLIVLVTELPAPPPVDKRDHLKQAKSRLRREVVHKLASGPKTHSELADVQHVLPHRDTVLLNEEGKLVNPDDASGAALEAALEEVADVKVSRGRLTAAADQWEVRRIVWDEYDPAFYHTSRQHHQTAAENRPNATSDSGAAPGTSAATKAPAAKTYAPRPPAAHPSFNRIRRDITADGVVAAITYRTIHIHCRRNPSKGAPPRFLASLRETSAYDHEAMSETVLARAIHLLTLGAYSWLDDRDVEIASSPEKWRELGGGGRGSVFWQSRSSPTPCDWIAKVLLAKPEDLTDNEWYAGEENLLVLLRRLADDGGCVGSFVAQDQAIRSGAAWICDVATKHSAEAAALFGKNKKAGDSPRDTKKDGESELERRKREAKERAMQRMQANAARFAAMMEAADDESDEDDQVHIKAKGKTPASRTESNVSSNVSSNDDSQGDGDAYATSTPMEVDSNHFSDPESSGAHCKRLLQDRPQCIIGSKCNNEDSVLAFCGFVQASVVSKGGGGPPTSITDTGNELSSISRFVGTHVTLCGHAVHSSCCESYLKSVSHREDRLSDRLEGGKRGEFRCPLCQRLSNCLVPFIDVGLNWADRPTPASDIVTDVDENEAKLKSTGDDGMDLDAPSCELANFSLHSFLDSSKWWFFRNDASIIWDGRCSIITTSAVDDAPASPASDDRRKILSSGSLPKKLRRSVRSFGKKDLFSAWGTVFKAPRFGRKRGHSRTGSASIDVESPRDDQIASAPKGILRSSSEHSSATDVWRKLMDQIAEVSHRADLKRLGEKDLSHNYGEFRHYLVEKATYNVENKAAGKENVDWPTCLSPTTLSEARRQELAREKLICKLLLSIQAFTYSCSSEGGETLRLRKKQQVEDSSNLEAKSALFSKFGVANILYESMVLLPEAMPDQDEGGQLFNGRIGKLRYFALSIMVATSAVCREIAQLALGFPIEEETHYGEDHNIARAPIVFPILNGHVLTHVIAAMCATCGRARARNDFDRGSESFYEGSPLPGHSATDSVLSDCQSFIKLGFLARTLQVLLGVYSEAIGTRGDPNNLQSNVQKSLYGLNRVAHGSWEQQCLLLLKTALDLEIPEPPRASQSADSVNDTNSRLSEACTAAKDAAISFLCDSGLILQVLCPGASAWIHQNSIAKKDNTATEGIGTLVNIMPLLGIESISEMMESPLVIEVVRSWYHQSTPKDVAEETMFAEDGDLKDVIPSPIAKRLESYRHYRNLDWPCCAEVPAQTAVNDSMAAGTSEVAARCAPLNVGGGDGMSRSPPRKGPSFSQKKLLPLFGAKCPFPPDHGPRIDMLPSSYTDLYARLGSLCPDFEQTALCLVCGSVLNAGGKGECTKHAQKCGGGAGIFFLLQECIGLMLHGNKAAYIHSPYVDSHGETPHYRGRPLNLDMERYRILQELWTSHTLRAQVIAERGNSRQVIITNFY